MKRIAILIQYLYGGGAERIAGLLSVYLCKHYEVYLFMIDVNRKVYEYGGTIIDVSVNGEVLIEQTIKEYKKKLKIDCAISFLEPMNFMNVRTKGEELVILSERCAIGEMSPYPNGDAAKIKKWYNYADKIVCVAYGVEYDLSRNFAVNPDILTTIYNFINKERILDNSKDEVSSEVLSFKGNSKLILNVGRMDPQKNQKKLIIQFASLVNSGLDVKLIIVGSGVLYPELSQLVKKLGLDKHVMFITYCSNPFIYYRISDVMVLSSDYEGLPNVVLEALLIGLPVVAVDCLSGPRELLKQTSDYEIKTQGYEVCNNGILVEKTKLDEIGETHFLAEAIKYMLFHDDTRNQIIKSGKTFMDSYTNELVEKKWLEVIETTEKKSESVPRLNINNILRHKKLIIYGAGVYGRMAMKPLLPYKNSFELLCFAVTKKADNPQYIYDIPVFSIDELTQYVDTAVVVIGVSYSFEREVTQRLVEMGFTYIYSEY